MMAAPVEDKKVPEVVRNVHQGAATAATPQISEPVLGPKALNVDRSTSPKEALDECAELFRIVFKGDIVP